MSYVVAFGGGQLRGRKVRVGHCVSLGWGCGYGCAATTDSRDARCGAGHGVRRPVAGCAAR